MSLIAIVFAAGCLVAAVRREIRRERALDAERARRNAGWTFRR